MSDDISMFPHFEVIKEKIYKTNKHLFLERKAEF